jgi:predicted DNA-binding transcriptional regulator AlpA
METPEIITVKDIAKMLGLHPGHVRDRMVQAPTFPAPIPFCNRPKKWIAEDVIRWLKRQ